MEELKELERQRDFWKHQTFQMRQKEKDRQDFWICLIATIILFVLVGLGVN